MPEQNGLISERKLVDIARHESKTIRIAQLLSETEAAFNINELGRLTPGSNHYDVLMALDADLNKSVSLIKDMALVVESLDSAHHAPEFKGGQSDISALFPKHYDKALRALTLFGVTIKADDYEKTSKRDNQKVKSEVYSHVFNSLGSEYSYERYKAHLSHVKVMEDNGAPGKGASLHSSIEYATGIVSINSWSPLYEATKELGGYYHALRAGLSDKASRLVTERVYEQHATIYGVTKKSTYITKKDGVDRISPSHKADNETINKLLKLVQDIPFIRAIEIDRDDSAVKFHDMLATIKSMNIDVPDAFELKSRRLGNHKASGLHAIKRNDGYETIKEMGYANNELRLIVVDPRAPTSLAHEITHFRDRDDDENRLKVVSHFSEKIDVAMLRELLGGSRIDYFLSDREVLARLGEIGFLLNDHKYRDGESIDDFMVRVNEDEKRLSMSGELKQRGENDGDKLQYDIALTKKLSDYISKDNIVNQQVYFNMVEWSPEEMSILRDYVHDFFFSPDPLIQKRLQLRINNGELDYQSKKYQEDHKKSPRKRRPLDDQEKVGKALGAIPAGKLAAVYQAGLKNNVLEDGEFLTAISAHPSRLSRGGGKVAKATLTPLNLKGQIEDYKLLAESLNPISQPIDTMRLAQFAFVYGKFSNLIPVNKQPDTLKSTESLFNTMTTAMELNSTMDTAVINDIKTLHKGSFAHIPVFKKNNDTHKSFQVFALEFAEAALKKTLQLAPTPEQMLGADDLTKLTFLSNELVKSFGNSSIKLDESTHDFWYEMSQSMAYQNLQSFTLESIGSKDMPFNGGGLEKLLPMPNVMSSFEGSDILVVRELLSNGWLEKFNIDEPVIDAFYAELKATHPDTKTVAAGKSGMWSLSELSGVGASQKVMNILSELKSHPARVDPETLYRKNTSLSTVYSDLYYKGKAVGNRQVNTNSIYRSAMSPMAALISLAKKANEANWEPVKLEVKRDLYDVLANYQSVFGLDVSMHDNVNKFDHQHRSALLGIDSEHKRGALQSQTPLTLLLKELMTVPKTLGFPGEGVEPTDFYKRAFIDTLSDSLIQQGENGSLSKMLLVGGGKGVLIEGQRFIDVVPHDVNNIVVYAAQFSEPPEGMKPVAPSSHYLHGAAQEQIAVLSSKLETFMATVEEVSPDMKSGFFAAIRNLSAPKAGFNAATYNMKLGEPLVRVESSIAGKAVYELQNAAVNASLPLVNKGVLFSPAEQIEATLSTKVDLRVDSVIPAEQLEILLLNKDVPKAGENGIIRKEHQMKMF
jgi:hypothetical protein